MRYDDQPVAFQTPRRAASPGQQRYRANDTRDLETRGDLSAQPGVSVQFLNTPSPPSDRHEHARVDGPDVPTRATIWNRLADPGRGAVGQCGRCRRARGRPQMECPGRERQSSAANGRRDAQHDRARAAERDVADTQLRRSMSDNSSPSALPPTANIGQDHRREERS
jgi:hypothetical protein